MNRLSRLQQLLFSFSIFNRSLIYRCASNCSPIRHAVLPYRKQCCERSSRERMHTLAIRYHTPSPVRSPSCAHARHAPLAGATARAQLKPHNDVVMCSRMSRSPVIPGRAVSGGASIRFVCFARRRIRDSMGPLALHLLLNNNHVWPADPRSGPNRRGIT
jgi:hypothetical protein